MSSIPATAQALAILALVCVAVGITKDRLGLIALGVVFSAVALWSTFLPAAQAMQR